MDPELGEDITPEDSIVPIYLVPLTEEEQTSRDEWNDYIISRDLEFEKKEIAKESALSKLEKLGITQEELSALLG